MAKRNNIVIIGGNACGPKAAARARRCDQLARITLIEQGKHLSQATCGLPYYISGVIKSESAMVTRKPDYFREVMNMEVFTGTRAESIDPQSHKVKLLNLGRNQKFTIAYDKLVLATGSVPAVPNFPGKHLDGIFTVTKLEDANSIRRAISSSNTRKATIIGAGLIGMEMAEAFAFMGLNVTVIELLDRVLPTLLDSEIAAHVMKHLQEKGIHVLLGERVTGFKGDKNGWVHTVTTADREIETELVLLALGAKPNTELARKAGLDIGTTGGIAINEYLQTSNADIYAGGDCVENVNRITGRKMLAPIGSTANKHGRVIGTNITGSCETFHGVLGTAIAKIFDYNVGRVGLSESQAREAGYEVITCLVPGPEYASYYPAGKRILVKLVADKSNSRLLGGQVVGLGDVAKRIDVLATALTFHASADDMAQIDLAYAPPYNSAMDPLHHAANIIRNKQSGFARALCPLETISKIESDDDFILLDVRSPEEWKSWRLDSARTQLIPLNELRERLNTIPRDSEIILYCRTSIRAYQAQRIFDGNGFKKVTFLDGSLAAWPYNTIGVRPSENNTSD